MTPSINTPFSMFRDQHFDDDELLDTGKRFGSIAPPRNHRSGDRLKHAVLADISNLDQNGELRKRDDHPPPRRPRQPALALRRLVPPDRRRAVDALCPCRPAGRRRHSNSPTCAPPTTHLDDDLRSHDRRSLVAEHSILQSRGLLGYTGYTEAERALVPEVRHPARAHASRLPAHNRSIIGSHASHIIDLPVPDGRLLLRELMEHATQQQSLRPHATPGASRRSRDLGQPLHTSIAAGATTTSNTSATCAASRHRISPPSTHNPRARPRGARKYPLPVLNGARVGAAKPTHPQRDNPDLTAPITGLLP